ncbi:polysaccharide deacetylase family protein [Desulfotomaculum copahuensis]
MIITFDYGYEAFHKYAYPQLPAHRMPATEFVL